MSFKVEEFNSNKILFSSLINGLNIDIYKIPILAGIISSITKNDSDAYDIKKIFSHFLTKNKGDSSYIWMFIILHDAIMYKVSRFNDISYYDFNINHNHNHNRNDTSKDNNLNYAIFFKGIPISSILEGIALLAQHKLISQPEACRILEVCFEKLKKESDIPTLKAIINVATTLSIVKTHMNENVLRETSLKLSLIALTHQYPFIRQYASQQLYFSFLLCGDHEIKHILNISKDTYNAFLNKILATNWKKVTVKNDNFESVKPDNFLKTNESNDEIINKLLKFFS